MNRPPAAPLGDLEQALALAMNRKARPARDGWGGGDPDATAPSDAAWLADFARAGFPRRPGGDRRRRAQGRRGLSPPILGDRQHGDGPLNRIWRADHGLVGLALHALVLAFDVPGQGPQRVICPPFDDLRRLLTGLPLWPDTLAAVPELATPAPCAATAAAPNAGD